MNGNTVVWLHLLMRAQLPEEIQMEHTLTSQLQDIIELEVRMQRRIVIHHIQILHTIHYHHFSFH